MNVGWVTSHDAPDQKKKQYGALEIAVLTTQSHRCDSGPLPSSPWPARKEKKTSVGSPPLTALPVSGFSICRRRAGGSTNKTIQAAPPTGQACNEGVSGHKRRLVSPCPKQLGGGRCPAVTTAYTQWLGYGQQGSADDEVSCRVGKTESGALSAAGPARGEAGGSCRSPSSPDAFS